MKKIILLLAFAAFLTSCNVTESIVFDKDMSGKFVSSFDMSPMLNFAKENKPASKEGPKKEKMDTTIVFDDLFRTHKDSIASLSAEQRERLEKMRGMTIDMHMDEEKGIFNFSMTKAFKTFEELKGVNDQVSDALGMVKDMGNKDGAAPGDQLDELTKTDRVTYAFENNTFSRFDPDKSLATDDLEEVEEEEEDDFGKQFEAQFEEVFSDSFYTLTYTFPRKIKSVSHEGAVISEDGKTVTYKAAWNNIQKDSALLDLKVVLED